MLRSQPLAAIRVSPRREAWGGDQTRNRAAERRHKMPEAAIDCRRTLASIRVCPWPARVAAAAHRLRYAVPHGLRRGLIGCAASGWNRFGSILRRAAAGAVEGFGVLEEAALLGFGGGRGEEVQALEMDELDAALGAVEPAGFGVNERLADASAWRASRRRSSPSI